MEKALVEMRELVAKHGLANALRLMEAVLWEKYDEKDSDKTLAGMAECCGYGWAAEKLQQATEFVK